MAVLPQSDMYETASEPAKDRDAASPISFLISSRDSIFFLSSDITEDKSFITPSSDILSSMRSAITEAMFSFKRKSCHIVNISDGVPPFANEEQRVSTSLNTLFSLPLR